MTVIGQSVKSWEYGYEKNVIRCLQCCLAQAYLHTKWHLDPFSQATLCMLDVRWDPALPRKGAQPQFLAHVCCGQTARWVKILLYTAHVRCRQMAGLIKMPLGTEVGLVPGDIVHDN